MLLVDFLYDNPIINTYRLVLRPLNENDIPDLLTWVSDKPKYKNATSDDSQCMAFVFEQKSSIKYLWGIQFKNKVVGELWRHLNKQEYSAKLAYRVAPLYRGNSIAQESIRAIADLFLSTNELKSIWADVYVNNTASIHALEKSGLHREKLIRHSGLSNSVCDYYNYEILNNNGNF